jgi:hypothetical protein
MRNGRRTKFTPVQLKRTGGRYQVARVIHDGAEYEIRHTGAVFRVLNPGDRLERMEREERPDILEAILEAWRTYLKVSGKGGG